MGLHSEHQGLWRLYQNVSLGTTAVPPDGDAIDFRGMSGATIYATSTHSATITYTVWSAATSTGPYRLLKTSTGGAVTTQVTAANSAFKLTSNLSGARWVKLSSSTTAAYKTIPWLEVRR